MRVFSFLVYKVGITFHSKILISAIKIEKKKEKRVRGNNKDWCNFQAFCLNCDFCKLEGLQSWRGDQSGKLSSPLILAKSTLAKNKNKVRKCFAFKTGMVNLDLE